MMYPAQRFLIQPRVYPDQREQFESGELFRKLSRESEVKYTGYRDRPLSERQGKFQAECKEGHADIAFVNTGTNLALSFAGDPWGETSEDRMPTKEHVDFEKEPGKVHLKSHFIMNGVCVIWKGWVDCQRLDGTGWLEFDEDKALREQARQRELEEKQAARVRDFETDQQRHYREQERHAEQEAENMRRMRRNGGVKLEQAL